MTTLPPKIQEEINSQSAFLLGLSAALEDANGLPISPSYVHTRIKTILTNLATLAIEEGDNEEEITPEEVEAHINNASGVSSAQMGEVNTTKTKQTWEEEFEPLEEAIENIEWNEQYRAFHKHDFVVDDIKSFIRTKKAEWEAEARREVIEEAITLVGTHTEKMGEYCDTGEDMDWACRSKCVEMAINRLLSLQPTPPKENNEPTTLS